MSLFLRFVTHSEIGLVRKNNQDSGYAGPHLLVVADGMGGAAAGDVASAVTVDTIRRIDEPGEVGPAAGRAMLELLAAAIRRANDRIADLVDADLSLDGMGTTVTAALFDGAQLGLAHIGDSRAYLLRDGVLERLTHDHSWVQSLVDDHKISPEEAAVHPHRSLLLKVINGQPANDPDLTLVDVRAGDRLLFCSDGLCGLVDDPEIAAQLALPDLEDALRHLVDEARSEGGIDNITVILADVADDAPPGVPAVIGAAAEHDVLPEVPVENVAGEDMSGEVRAGQDATGQDRADKDATVEDDEARYNPQQPTQRRLRRTLAGIVVAVLIVGAALSAGYAWSRTQYYVGAADDNVAIYRGVVGSLPGVPLHHVYEQQPIPLSSLPGFYQNMVRSTIQVEGLEAARQTVATLSTAAEECRARKRSPSSSTSPKTRPPSQPSTSVAVPTAASPGPSTSAPTTTRSSSPAQSSAPASSRPGPVAPLPPGAPAPGEGC